VVDTAANDGPVTRQAYTLLERTPAEISIVATDADKLEGTARGTTPFVFDVTLSAPVDWDITLTWRLSGAGAGSAFFAGDDDFPGSGLPSGTVVLEAGSTRAQIAVNVGADSFFSQDEAFTVTLYSVESAVTFAASSAEGIIRNDDALKGTSGKNRLVGSESSEAISGLAGNDTINGGAGDDTISGGSGLDVMTGGLGADVFVFDQTPKATEADVIVDFQVGVDRIALSGSVFGAAGASGALAETAFAYGTSAMDPSDRLIYDQASGRLFWDADGSGSRSPNVLLATLQGAPVLDAEDFFIL
jgi:Ca2+-binding RTX toxin-like protein